MDQPLTMFLRPYHPAVFLLVLSLAGGCRADYLDEVGYTELAALLGPGMPTGSSVAVSHVEATGGSTTYMPQAGSGIFDGTGPYFLTKRFTAKSGEAAASGHAFDVGAHFYSQNTLPSAGRASMSPGVTLVDGWKADDYDDLFLAPSGGAPVVESRMVQNHSWIYYSTAANATVINKLIRHMDYAINRDGFLSFAGVNNGPGTATPDLFAACYNNIAVGLSSGAHSTGGTSSFSDGPGRLKPDIVAPLPGAIAFTSFSTPLVASAAILLRDKVNTSINSTNSRKPQLLKACLLAGATKDEFPAWSKSATVPLDATFGAGELNVLNSYRILTGLEQAANQAAARPDAAWDVNSMAANGTADYRLSVPAGTYGTELSAVAVWHRTLTDPAGGGFNIAADELAMQAEEITSDLSVVGRLQHPLEPNLPHKR